jgi:hypothetical protein
LGPSSFSRFGSVAESVQPCNIELVSELAGDLGLVKIDLAQAQHTILNLVLNARDAMPDGGRVTLSIRNCDGPIPGRDGRNQFCDWVSFAVSDTGCGMNAETRSCLFEPFFTTKKPGKGNGLGLSTVHRIVTHEGGRIEVESEAGRGTRVVVHLPRVSEIPTAQCLRSWGQDRMNFQPVMGQLLLDAEPEDVDTILKHMGTAVPVYSNFALSRIERVSRELRSALSPAQARIAGSKAEGGTGIAQRTEGKDSITALLLSCEMVLDMPNLPLFAETKMRVVDALAKEMRMKRGMTT